MRYQTRNASGDIRWFTPFLFLAISLPLAAAETADVVIVGSTPAGLTAAAQLTRMGKKAIVLSDTDRIGGMTTAGLGRTDVGRPEAFGGLTRDFYRSVSAYATGEWSDGTQWCFSPSAALRLLEIMEKREGIDIRRGERIDRRKVKVEGQGQQRRITSLQTLGGTEYRAKVFVDATYEGDLMAAAGVTYTLGREGNEKYGEKINGAQPGKGHHRLSQGIDPYVVKGDPTSGLLPGVESEPMGEVGSGDRRLQAYCYRLCLTDVESNRVPFAKPDGYDAREYELLFRHYECGEPTNACPFSLGPLSEWKCDANNTGGVSFDWIGHSVRWPEASYAEREEIAAAHRRYQQGLLWTLANHPRVPQGVRDLVSRWGLAKDEFTDSDHWPRQIYVREARRLVGEYVMTEHDCRRTRRAPRPVACGAYQMDSHHCRRYVGADGFVHNEGDVQDGQGGALEPYGIDYLALVPKRGECANLLVPVCLSASHIAYGSLRMEPVFFALGQAAGTAAALALDAGCAVQDVDYPALRRRLVADGQALVPEGRPPAAYPNITTIQRFRSSLSVDEAVWKGTLAELAKAPEAADEVWFSTGISFPTLDWHRAFSKKLARQAEDLRAIGILPGLEIQAVIGHGDSIVSLTGDFRGKTWTGWTDPDGVEAKTCNCPRQPAMRAYFVELAKIYAAWKPSSIWFDDDFTTRGRTERPGCAFRGWRHHGCFCDLCVSTFARQEGRAFTRSELAQAIERDEALRNRWMAYSYDVLATLAEEVAKAIHAISPETRMGYQHGFNTRDNWQRKIFEALHRGSGHDVGSRPGGGAYRDEAPCWLVHKALEEGFQMRAIGTPAWINPIVPEIENCPRTLTTKTAAGMRLEALCALGAGMNGLSYFAFDEQLESPAWAGRQVFGPIARDAAFFRSFIRANAGTRPCGLMIAPSSEYVDAEAVMHGVPLLTAPGDARGTYLAGADVDNAKDDELKALLAKGGLVIDGDAAEKLSARGLTADFGGIAAAKTSAAVAERYTTDPVNAGFDAPTHRRFGVDSHFCRAPKADRVRVLGEYFAHGEKIGDGTMLVEHGGQRYAILGSPFWSGALSSDRLLQLARIADWVSGDRLPVRIERPAHVALFPRVCADGAFASVVVCNSRMDDTDGVTLRVRGVMGEGSFVWQEPGGTPVPVRGRPDGDDVLVTLPKMAAWHAGVLSVHPLQ